MAGINVQINPGQDASSSSVTATGFVQHIITDNEVNSFGLQDGNLKNAVGRYFGQNPDDAYLRSPTPWNDLYSTYGWSQTQTTLVPISATVASVTSTPMVIASQTFTNNSGKTGTFNVNLTEQVQNTTQSSWNVTKTVDVSQSINYGISFSGVTAGGSTSMSYSEAWAQGGSQSESVTVGASQGVSVDLESGQSVLAQLTASRGTMTVQIVYEASLSGATAINYGDPYKGHHFWGLDLPSVMQSGGIANSIQFSETIVISYFLNSTVTLTDPAGGTVKQVAARAGGGPSL